MPTWGGSVDGHKYTASLSITGVSGEEALLLLCCGCGRAAVRVDQHLRDSTNLLLCIYSMLVYSCICMSAVLSQCWLYVVVRTIVRH